jgi:hypothetical protein
LRRESLIILGLLIAFPTLFCAVVGVATGRIIDQDLPAPTGTLAPPTPTRLPPTPVPTLPSSPVLPITGVGQRSLLLIGVDDLQRQPPNLEGCWVVTYLTDVPAYYVLAFPPSARFSLDSLGGQPLTLAEIFAQDYRLQRGFQFTRDAINTRFEGFALEADVVIDRANLVQLIADVGGLDDGSLVRSGAEVLVQYDAIEPSDSQRRLEYQGEVLSLLFAALGQRQWTPAAFAARLQQLPQMAADPALQSALTSFAASAPPFAGPTPVWRTYEPSMEALAHP